MTTEILQDNLWSTITQLARKSKRRHVAVAYLGQGASRLLPLRKGDSLLIDMSERAVKNGQTAPGEVEEYLKRGVDVYTCSNLHAKVYIFDKTLIVGSANVSQHSQRCLIEVGLLCRDRDVVAQTLGLIRSFQVEPVTPEYVKLCKKLYIPPDIANKRFRPVIPTHSPLWVVSVEPADFSGQEERLRKDGETKASRKLKDTGKFEVSSIRFVGKSRFTESVMVGDLLVQIWNDGNVTEVYPPCRVLRLTRYRSFNRQKQPRIFVHIEEPKRPNPLPWREFKEAAVEAGLHRISTNSVRQIRSPKIAHAIKGLWT